MELKKIEKCIDNIDIIEHDFENIRDIILEQKEMTKEFMNKFDETCNELKRIIEGNE